MSKPPAKSPQLQQITPPASFAAEPLTPPLSEESFSHVHRVLAILKARKEGIPIELSPWMRFHLAEGGFEEIERRIERDDDLWGYVEDKIRYDYDARKHLFVIRMPTSLTHEKFIRTVERHVLEQLNDIAKGSNTTAKFAGLVGPDGSGSLVFPAKDDPPLAKSNYCPDAQYAHRDARYPGVIIEVSYSQKRKDLKRLAQNYLIDSRANVRVVIGLDVEYGPKASRQATLSVWRVHFDHNAKAFEAVAEVDNELFRDNDGNATNSLGMQIRLSEFAPQGMPPGIPVAEDRVITVSAQQLCQYLTEAERRDSMKPPCFEESPPPGYFGRKDPSSSPDRITSDDEDSRVKQEDRADERTDAADPDRVDPEGSGGQGDSSAGRRRTRRG